MSYNNNTNTLKSNFYSFDVKENEEGELYIEFSEEFLKQNDWQIGDNITFKTTSEGIVLVNSDLNLRDRIKAKQSG